MHAYMDKKHLSQADDVTLSFSKAAAFILCSYFIMRFVDMLVHGNAPYLFTPYGAWWLLEMFGFVLTPAILYAKGSRELNVPLCRAASALAVAGIVLNRFTISMIAYNWQLPADERYFPCLSEIMVSVFVVTMIVTAYRFICYHMPILYEHPDFKEDH